MTNIRFAAVTVLLVLGGRLFAVDIASAYIVGIGIGLALVFVMQVARTWESAGIAEE